MAALPMAALVWAVAIGAAHAGSAPDHAEAVRGSAAARAGLARKSGDVPPPPDHPALRERFQFLGPVLRVHRNNTRRSQHPTVGAAITARRLLGQDPFAGANLLLNSSGMLQNAWTGLAAALGGYWPERLEDEFAFEKKLGEGSFGVTYLAKDKKNKNETVAVKVLIVGGEGLWITPYVAENVPEVKQILKESTEECSKIKKIHENSAADGEGSKFVVRCLEDGITETLADPDKKFDPLFIVMNYAGKEALKWWTEDVLDEGRTAKQISKTFRKVSRDMMMGLRFMTHPDAKLKWVHHDLKPLNMAVDETAEGADLTIIDLGTALSNKQLPSTKAVCTPIYKPPEFAGLANTIGYSLPMHSFDTSSAALTLLGMAGNPTQQYEILSYPVFVQSAIATGMKKALGIHSLAKVANCIAELNGHQKEDVQQWTNAYAECMSREGIDYFVRADIEAQLDKVRKAGSMSSRIAALTALVGCLDNSVFNASSTGLAEFLPSPARKDATHQILTEWVQSGFDQVILSMLDMDPKKRPMPAKVLAEKWLAEDFVPGEEALPLPQVLCTSHEYNVRHAMRANIWLPLAAILGAGAFATMCCCAGACMNFCGGVPSAGFTGLVAGMFVFSTAIVSTVWLSQTVSFFLLLISLMVGPALCFTGCKAAGSDYAPMSPWGVSLIAGGVFCLLVFMAMRWVSGPTIDMLTFMLGNIDAINAGHQTMDVGIKFQQWSLRTAQNLVWLTFYPPWGGLAVILFGIWRRDVHWRLNYRGPVTRQVTGTEMRSPSVSAPRASARQPAVEPETIFSNEPEESPAHKPGESMA